ncbi:MAG: hypothetical protein WCJ61_03680 [Paludibacter sp.]
MKTIYFIVCIAVLALFTACEDFNTKNFSDLDLAANPTNLINYTYELASVDYNTIANTIKKPIEDKITIQNNLVTAKQNELKTAANAADSLRIKTELAALKIIVNDSINKLKLDSLYTTATAISTNKYFKDSLQFKKSIPYLLSSKYMYGDEKSSALITFNFVIPYDTTKIILANKCTLLPTDYASIAKEVMGTDTATTKWFKFFSTTYSPDYYIPLYLKRAKFPYAKQGDVKLVRYLYASTTSSKVDIYTFDGTNWIKYNTTQLFKAKFVVKSAKWEFIDTDILIGLTAGIGDFTAVNVIGDQVWGWNSYKYMLMTGYVSGAYFTNEDWLISPPMNLSYRNSPWLTFTHVGRYFGDSGTSTEKMRKAISVWISDKSDGKTIVPEDWTELTFPEAGYPSGLSWTFIPSTPISLASFIGKNNVRIAFKYTSSAADGAAGSWEVKNVYIYEK